MYFRLKGHETLLVDEGHHVASVVVTDKEERFQGSHVHLLAIMIAQVEHALPVEPAATRGKKAPNMPKGNCRDSVARHVDVAGLLCLCQCGLTLAEPNGGLEISNQGVVRTTELCFSGFPNHGTLWL